MRIRLWQGLGILMALTLLGCGREDFEGLLVQDEFEEELREVLHQVGAVQWGESPGGNQRLNFQYRYGLGLQDAESIAQVTWTFGLLNAEGMRVGDWINQEMRRPNPEKTEVFVVGKRDRFIDYTPGLLPTGDEYVLFFRLCYRGLILGEHLEVVTIGEDFTLDPNTRPDLPTKRIGDRLPCEEPLPPPAPL